jgi:hypothetical protein
LLAHDGRLKIFTLLLDFAVLFQELVQQHRVYRFLANASPGGGTASRTRSTTQFVQVQ